MPIPDLRCPAPMTCGRLLASILVLASLTLWIGVGDGAETIPVAAGDRVRLLADDERPVAGRLLAFDARAVELVAEPDSVPRVPPRIGDRVRVTLLAGPPPVTGRLVLSDTAGLGVRLDGEAVGEDRILARRLARESIAGLEVARTHSHPWRGALVGALLMPAIMAAAISLSEPQGEENLAYVGVIFGGPIVGAVFGAFIGGSIEHARWDPAPLPDPAESTAVRPSAR